MLKIGADDLYDPLRWARGEGAPQVICHDRAGGETL